MNDRWKMNRIGFINFWLYDEEIFSFADGKLLLRGQNGSGKSITTQSFIPASNEPSDCLQAFGDCREGQIPRSSAVLQI